MRHSNMTNGDNTYLFDDLRSESNDYDNTLQLLKEEKSKQKKFSPKMIKGNVDNNTHTKRKGNSELEGSVKFIKKEKVPDDFLLLDRASDSFHFINEDKTDLLDFKSPHNLIKEDFLPNLPKDCSPNESNTDVTISYVVENFNKQKEIKDPHNKKAEDYEENNLKEVTYLEKALEFAKKSKVPDDFLLLDRAADSLDTKNENKVDSLNTQKGLFNKDILEANIKEEGYKNIEIAIKKLQSGTIPDNFLSKERVQENIQINFVEESEASNHNQPQDHHRDKRIKNIDYIVYEKLVKRYIFKSFQDQLFIYSPETGCYNLLNDKQLKVIIRSGWDKNIEEQLTRFKVDDVIDRLRNSSNIISEQEFDDFSDYINFRNGVFSLIDYKLYPHSPHYNFTSYIDACYNFQEPKGETFVNFINQCSEREKDKIKTLQEIIGYAISNYTTAKKFFVFVGKPHTGKSTLLEVLQEIVGKKYTSAIPLHRLGERFMKARLLNIKLNISGELTDGLLKDIDTIKALTGNDEIEAEFKGKDPFSFKNKAKLLFAGNHMPLLKNVDNTSAFFDRIVFSLFNNTIPEHERDHLLKEKLLAERDYIVTWAVEGLKRLVKNNFVFSECKESRNFKNQYIKEMNTVQDFLESHCIINKFNETFKTHKKELYSEYLKFCSENCYTTLNKYNFFNEIKKIDLKQGKFRKNGSVPLEGFYGIIINQKIY